VLGLKRESHILETRVQSLKTRDLSDPRSIHKREGRVDKTKHESHQTRVLFINARVTFIN